MMASAAFLCAALVAVTAPAMGVVVCLILLVLQLILAGLRFAVGTKAPRRAVAGTVEPCFSIHVATHDEPSAVVIHTLDRLAALDFPPEKYEVIVLDNNTADPDLWRPVEGHCRRLGRQFLFRHEMGVRGAKAGALNRARGLSRRDATHVVIVDADYGVTPDFLTQARAALARTGADYVQFPQAYRRPAAVAKGIDVELEDYFRVEAEMADGAEAVLLTGTLCVISCTALDAVGGWSGRTTTEDAELGVRLCRAGYSGRFIPRIVGSGLLPLRFADLASQRARWSGGNLRTLAVHLPAVLRSGGDLGPRKVAALAAQLGAWLNLCLVPVAFLLAATVGQGSAGLATIAGAVVILTLVDIVVRLVRRGVHDGLALRAVLAAIASRLALAPASAVASLRATLPGRQTFVVTAKDATPAAGPSMAMGPHGLIFVAAGAALLQPSLGTVPDLALLALLLPLPAAIATSAELGRYRRFVAKAPASAVAEQAA